MTQKATERRTVQIREVDVEAWTLLRAEAVRQGTTTAAVLEEIVRAWARNRGARWQIDDSDDSDSRRAGIAVAS